MSEVISKKVMGFSELRQWLRHQHPMIFLDRVIDYTPGESLDAIMVVSGNMDCIAGHFPGRAIMPGTHLQQSFCQAAVILLQLSSSRLEDDEIAVVASMNSRFQKPAVPGDVVQVQVKVDRLHDSSFMFSGKAMVDGELVATIKSIMVRTKLEEGNKPLW